MSQAACPAYRPGALERPGALDELPLRYGDEFESIFSKFARHLAILWTGRKTTSALLKLDADQLRDIGIRPWQVGEIGRKAAEAQLVEPRRFSS